MKVNYTPCKICLITGYLGAGKTTLLNKVLEEPGNHKIAVIVNDIGEINIDAKLIAKSGGGVTEQTGDLVPLTNGCICCNLSQDLAQQLSDLACTNKYDYIVIEASGICEPIPIAQTITMMAQATKDQGMPAIVEMDNIVSVCDAARLVDEFNCGDDLEATDYDHHHHHHHHDDDDDDDHDHDHHDEDHEEDEDEDEEDLASLITQQLEFCNTVVLNKIDLVSEEEKNKVAAVIHALNPGTKIIEASYGNVPVADIFDTGLFDYERSIMSAGWIAALENPHEHDHDSGEALEYGIETYVFERREPFYMEKLQSVFMNWPENIIRTKGYVWFRENPNDAFILEQAGRQVTIQPDGIWLACAPKKDREEAFAEYPDLADDWDDVFGDRVNRLVIIGQKLDKEWLHENLQSAIDADFRP